MHALAPPCNFGTISLGADCALEESGVVQMKNAFCVAGAATIVVCTLIAQASAADNCGKPSSMNECMSQMCPTFQTAPNTPARQQRCNAAKKEGKFK
jgi:hypothetical protein